MGNNGRVSLKRPKADAVCVEAVDVARTALAGAVSENGFGGHLGHVAEDERVVTHFFEVTAAGYRGWRWAVTVGRAPRLKTVTVSEIVMLPGEGALLAPAWVPYSSRLQPDDLGPGDLLPVAEGDPRLVPGYLVGEAEPDRATRDVIAELGLGREWVLSAEGREQAADRWYADRHGPDDDVARGAPAACGSCGFLVRIAGPLSGLFGLCANANSPSDGSVVSYNHGCGAHSSVRTEPEATVMAPATPYFDTVQWDDFEPFAPSTR